MTSILSAQNLFRVWRVSKIVEIKSQNILKPTEIWLKTAEKGKIFTTVVVFIKTSFYKETKLNHRLVFWEIKLRTVRHREVIFSMFSLCFTGLPVSVCCWKDTALYVFPSEIQYYTDKTTSRLTGCWPFQKRLIYNCRWLMLTTLFCFQYVISDTLAIRL